MPSPHRRDEAFGLEPAAAAEAALRGVYAVPLGRRPARQLNGRTVGRLPGLPPARQPPCRQRGSPVLSTPGPTDLTRLTPVDG